MTTAFITTIPTTRHTKRTKPRHDDNSKTMIIIYLSRRCRAICPSVTKRQHSAKTRYLMHDSHCSGSWEKKHALSFLSRPFWPVNKFWWFMAFFLLNPPLFSTTPLFSRLFSLHREKYPSPRTYSIYHSDSPLALHFFIPTSFTCLPFSFSSLPCFSHSQRANSKDTMGAHARI